MTKKAQLTFSSLLQALGEPFRGNRLAEFSPGTRVLFGLTLFLRLSLFAALAWLFVFQFDVGNSFLALCGSAALGIGVASQLAFSRARFLFCLAFLILAYLLGAGGIALFSLLEQIFQKSSFFASHIRSLHFELHMVFFGLALLATWAFWRISWYAFLECLAFASALLAVFAGHQNFRFDSPRIVNSWAWDLGVSNIAMLGLLGMTGTGIMLALYALPLLPAHPRQLLLHPNRRSVGKKFRILASSGFLLALMLAIFWIGKSITAYYEEASATRIANGVGSDSSEGLSPLGFHSALGSTNQPSALLRLDGDYPDNPFQPMLYLRENALSKFNGQEMVVAKAPFDADAHIGSPGSAFEQQEDVRLRDRIPLYHSVYLLTKHQDSFAIDYPLQIRALKNPDPKRFLQSYRAYSLVPRFSLDEIAQADAGDETWTTDVRKAYLETHPDPRYATLAARITEGLVFPGEKAFAIARYLSKHSIYTLTPNHDVQPGDDKVAPYIFGDQRGYCVHFSHATVYLLRALGIPSRIATGYLTDLSDAKDGHVLLRMSDRHAWAEAYFQGFGWVAVDTQPEQVENHANTDMDMGLLEELMDLLGLDEELLPENLVEDEQGVREGSTLTLPSSNWLLLPLFLLAFVFLCIKFWLRRSFRYTSDDLLRTRRLYRSLVSHYIDIGYQRHSGETLKEFQQRLSREMQARVLSLTSRVLETKYAQDVKIPLSQAAAEEVYRGDLRERAKLSWIKKLASIFHIRSVIQLCFGRNW